VERDLKARRLEQRRRVRRRRQAVMGLLAVMLVAVGLAATLHGGGAKGASTPPAPGSGGSGTPGRTTTATTPVAPAPPVADASPVSVAVVGDTVMGSLPYGLPPDGGASLFTDVAPLLKGDVVLGNLEGTLSSGGGSKCGAGSSNCFAFQTPPSYARWLKQAGFTVMNLANNHAFDFGPSGQRQTVAALTGAGIRNTGRPGTMAVQTVKGQRVALLGFAPYTWADSLLDIPRAKRRVQEAARSAQIVIVMIHAGAEGSDKTHVPAGSESSFGEDRGNSRAFTHAVIDAGADLVVGSGPHVLRGMEVYKSRLIAYSLGNFMGYEVFGLGGTLSTSAVLQATINPDGTFRSGRIRPTQLVGVGTAAQGGSAIPSIQSLSRTDFGARAPRIADDGTIRPRT
jgi:hypothetical protein